MNMLGLNPNEQEVIDIPNHVARQNTIYLHIIIVCIYHWSIKYLCVTVTVSTTPCVHDQGAQKTPDIDLFLLQCSWGPGNCAPKSA